MCRIRVFVIALALGPLIPHLARTEDPAKDLAVILVSGTWVKDHGTPPLQDQHVYTFTKDGRYTYKLVTDHTTPTVSGSWVLATGKDGKALLRLNDQQGQKAYYWLAQESIVRYDPRKDVLLVSGERYDGEQPLRHVRGEKK